MKALADKNNWRDTFKDQLHVDYKDWLYNAVEKNLSNKSKAKFEQDSICGTQFTDIGKQKDPIKKKVHYFIEQKERGRAIESKDRRLVHFIFNTQLPSEVSPFARKFEYF